MSQSVNQFVEPNSIIVPIDQIPSQIEGQKWLMILSFVALLSFSHTRRSTCDLIR